VSSPDGSARLFDEFLGDGMTAFRINPDDLTHTGEEFHGNWRDKLADLPTVSAEISGYLIGDCTVEIRDIGTDRERLVVIQADPAVMASAEIVKVWFSDGARERGVVVQGRRVTFGTEGEGEGRVSYDIAEEPDVPGSPLASYLMLRVSGAGRDPEEKP
jgi:hypothetical protein